MSAHRIIVAGCAPDTGNLGVSALFESTVTQIADRVMGAAITVLDHGHGARHAAVPREATPLAYERAGAVLTRRLHRRNSWFQIELAARLGSRWNTVARRFREASAVLDVSGGDSFTDLYGRQRFEAVARPKRMALRVGAPLVLLPQTYGPFESPGIRDDAARLVRGAAAAWARDARSFSVLKELLGDRFDPERHQLGVDMAFLLQPREPRTPPPPPLAGWLVDDAELYGINVSGLIYSDPAGARDRYGFRADYREVVVRLTRHLLAHSDGRVALIPHVLTPPGHYESDVAACEAVRAAVSDPRVAVLPADHDQAEIKSIIGRTHWFCGTRMHSTIAALSSGVPTAAIAYSPKTLGVFETCGQGKHVADPRSSTTDEVVAALVDSWTARAQTRVDLAGRLAEVFAQAEQQMDRIAAICVGRPGAASK